MKLDRATDPLAVARRKLGARELVIGAVLLALGIVVTAVTFGGDGTRLVAYGPMAVGFIVLVRGLYHLGRGDQAFGWLTIGAAAVVLLILGMIAVTMVNRARPVLGHMGLDFFTTSTWSEQDNRFGALPYIWGTMYTAVIAVVLAVPVSLGVSLYITQIAPTWLKKPLIYLIDLLAVVPSVVFGLWGVVMLTPHLNRSYLTAGIILAIMIIPIITSLAREVIETTAQADKEAAFALGATRWEMIGAAVLPHSKGGLVGAVMLGLGRAMGETIAAALVIGSSPQIAISPLASGDSMPAVIANQWGEASDLQKSALIALAVTLFVLTIIVNLIASAIVRRSMAKSRGTGG